VSTPLLLVGPEMARITSVSVEVALRPNTRDAVDAVWATLKRTSTDLDTFAQYAAPLTQADIDAVLTLDSGATGAFARNVALTAPLRRHLTAQVLDVIRTVWPQESLPVGLLVGLRDLARCLPRAAQARRTFVPALEDLHAEHAVALRVNARLRALLHRGDVTWSPRPVHVTGRAVSPLDVRPTDAAPLTLRSEARHQEARHLVDAAFVVADAQVREALLAEAGDDPAVRARVTFATPPAQFRAHFQALAAQSPSYAAALLAQASRAQRARLAPVDLEPVLALASTAGRVAALVHLGTMLPTAPPTAPPTARARPRRAR
jgi:hypothetical protein